MGHSYETSMADIDGYLATKQGGEIVGVCFDGDACPAHNTLVWKYGLENSEIVALSVTAWVTSGGVVNFPEDVVHAVSIFDNLKKPLSAITKDEFVQAMAEGGLDHAV